jgi:hypothetical protein
LHSTPTHHNYLGDIAPKNIKKVILNDLKELENVMLDILKVR